MTRRTIRTAATSSLALAVALAAAPAAAQSFQGTPTVTFGSATVTEGTGTTDVAVNSSSAVIDWTPDDTATGTSAPILFQPTGTTATYAGAADFAVLNRIVPTDISRAIIFDGAVLSRVAGLSGGTVFFYSPGGVIIGANAFFDVGNLGLTTAEPVVDGNGNWYTGNQVQFQQAASSSFIDIQQGAQISALSDGSYIAAFAPHIVQDGTINVNGQAALVAAEAGTITFSPDGLFDIAVTIGTDGQGGFGISHSGTTTGPASSGPGDNHRIYMVAIPKNSLLTLGIERGSEIGFDIAGAADTVGNAVILSAGRNLVGEATVTSSRVAGGNITINDSNSGNPGTGIDFTSRVVAVASDTLRMDVFRQTNFASNAILVGDNLAQASVGAIPADSTGSLTVGGNLVLDTNLGQFSATDDTGLALLFASDGGSIDVAGDVTVRAAAVGDTDGDGVVEGGTAQINLSGGTMDVGGTVLVQAAGFNESGIAVTGGNAQVNLFGASALTVGQVLRIDSNGIAGSNNGQTGAGGDGTGGFSGVLVAEGSSLTTNELNVTADGVGGADAGAGGGAAFGGGSQISVDGAGSALTVTSVNATGMFASGELDLLSAESFGGTTAIAGSTGGSAQGGTAGISVTNGGNLALPVAIAPDIRILGRAAGGSASADGSTGGNAVGGTVSVFLDNGTLTGDGFLFSSFAQGGNAVTGATGTINGGDATGGNRVITIQNGSSFSGSATGGPGAVGGNGTATGTGGDGTGGSATLLVDNSILNVSALGFNSFTQNFAGSGGVGGNASGGTSFAQISNGAIVNLVAGSTLSVGSNNFAGAFAEESDATGGNVTGGNATLLVENATITGPGTVEVSAGGTGGSVLQGQGGNGTGGTAHLQLRGATINVSDIVLDASGNGGSADPALLVPPPATVGAGNGGNGTGGFALITAESGANVMTANFLGVDADGVGGNASGASGNGGAATGGQSTLLVDAFASLAVNGSIEMSADAQGGLAGFFDPMTSAFTGIGTGGDSIGGNAHLATNGGTLTISGDVELEGEADAGMGVTGGNATAGSFLVQANGGSIGIAGDVNVEADAYGGAGTTNGGDAMGSLDSLVTVNAFLLAENGGSVTVGGTTSLATTIEGGFGGNGGSGGDATGGATLVLAKSNTASSAPSTMILNDVFAVASATGGAGGSVASGSGATGGAGGNAQAGQTLVLGDAGNGQLTINGLLDAAATGDGGAGGDGDVGGAGGFGQGGNLQIGTRSGQATADNSGSATFTDIISVAAGVGGDGGQGFVGAGGAGGEGGSGNTTILVRGSVVNITGTAQLFALGTGGNGGVGATGDGPGGDGFINGGGVAVVASNRFQIPANRGTLNANVITGLSQALGGTGATSGASILATEGAVFSFLGADGNINSLSFTVIADQITSTTPDLIEVKNGNVDIGSFSFVSANDLVLDLDTATLTTVDYLTDTRSIQLPATAPAVAGTVIATNSFAIFTDLGADTLTYVNFDVATGINFNNPGNFQTGDLTADGDIIMTTVGNLVTGNLASTGQILLTTNGNQTVGNVTSGGATNFNVDGTLIAGQVQTGGGFTTLVDGNQTIGNVIAGDSVDIRGGADISVGSIMGAASVYVISTGGVVTTGAIDAGDPALTDGKRFGIALRGSSLTTGNLATQGPIIAAAESGTMTLGNVSSGSSVLLLGAGDIATGSVAGGTDPGETFYVGGVDNLARLGAGDDFQPIIAVDPSPTGGSVTLGGPVSADRVLVAAGGTAAINGMVTAPFAQFVSGDIAIGTSGGIDTGTGQVRLVSSNASGMFVGDGGSGGYTLDNAEFSRVRGSEIFIAGVDGSSPIDMTIGNLSISGSQTGPNGTVVFATGDLATMTSSGGIRVNGEVVATNQTPNNYLEFYAALIEVNAQIGGIRSYSGTAPTGTGNPGVNALGGIVVLEANNVHVASDTILQKLRADPFYSGHAAELNQPGAINRPNGALTALGIEFYPGETLYIQNTGTADNPAGFYATLENSDIDPFVYEGNGTATPQVEVVINGSFASPNGDVSGQPAYQLIIDNAESLDGFSGASQVNGCSFDTGACGPVVVVPEEEAPPTNNAEIQALTEDQSEEEPFDTEEDEDEAEQAASSPIAPPVVLINTSPLNPDVDVTDPVSGTGNPALIGASISQPSQGDQQ